MPNLASFYAFQKYIQIPINANAIKFLFDSIEFSISFNVFLYIHRYFILFEIIFTKKVFYVKNVLSFFHKIFKKKLLTVHFKSI